MATTTQQAGSKKFVDFDEFIDFQLSKTRSNIKLVDMFTAAAGVAAMVVAYLLVFVVFDHWVVDGGFGNSTRWLMLGGLLVTAIGWVVWRVVLPYTKNVTGLYAAQTIEASEPGLKSGLMNLVDSNRSGRKVPEHIRTAMEKQAAVALAKTNVDEAVDRRPLMRLSYVLLALVVMFCLYAVISPKTISGSIWRALLPASDTAVDTTIKIDKVSVILNNPGSQPKRNGGKKLLEPNLTVPSRSKLEVVVDLLYVGDVPEDVVLYYTTQDGKYENVPVPMAADPDEVKRYRARLTGGHGRGILQNTTYRIEAGDAKAGPFEITVTHPPIASVNSLTYRYPKYMARDAKTQRGGHIDTWEGTVVAIQANSDRPVREAWVVFHDSEDISKITAKRQMTVTGGTQLSIELDREIQFRDDGSYPHFYHILCEDKTGLTDPRPVLYGVTLHRDLAPQVEIVDPAGNDIDRPSNTKSLPIMFRAKDPDFQLSFITLRAELTRANGDPEKPELIGTIVSDKKQQTTTGTYEWNLREHLAKPGDSLRFRLEAQDNKTPEANRGYSRWVTIHFTEPVDEKELQKQRERDQQRQEQKQQEQQEQNGGEQPQDEPPKQPKDGNEGKPQDGNDDKPKKDGTKPSEKKKRGDGGKQEKTDNPEPGENPDRQNGDDPGAKPNPDGGLSQDQIRKFNEELRKEEKKEQEKKENAEKPKKGPKPKDGGKPKSEQNGGKDPRNGMGKDPKPKNADPKNGGEEKPKPPMPKTDGDGKTKNMRQDDNAEKPKTKKQKQSGMGEEKSKTGDESGGAEGKTDNGMKNADPMKNGTATDPKGPKPKASKSGMGTQQDKNPSDSKTKKTNDPGKGMTGNDPDKSPAKKKKATGEETGDAVPNNDPKADPTKAKDPKKIKTDPKDQKVKRQGTEDGMPMAKQKDPKPKSGDGQKTPGKAQKTPSKTPTAKSGQKPPPSKSTDGSKPPQKVDPNKPSGKQPPKGSGSEPGKTDSNQGSKKPGTGNDPPKPGKNGEGNDMKTGPSGKQPSKTPGSQPAGSQPGMGQDGKGMGKQTDGNPNSNVGGGNAGSRAKKSSDPEGPPGGGTGPFNAEDKGNPTPPAKASPQAKSEYGKKAVDLTLKYLEDKLKRGDTNKDWLKKHGFSSKKQLKNAIDIHKQKQNNAVRSEAKKKQLDNFYRSLHDDKFQSKLGVQRGDNTRTRDVGVGSAKGSEAPPSLKDYYKSFTESIGRRRKK